MTIGSVAPPRLVFSGEAFGTLRAGQPIDVIGVNIWDSSSQVEVNNGSNITLNVLNSSGAVVQTLTEAAQYGTADFSGLTIPTAGTYTITASGRHDSSDSF